ncbi:MAG: copper homeostasis protein CutC [Bacteroidetes bacterium]|nr:MAG: copper homeostasis protein CutC [Bacteroidota bacterium]
MHRVLLEICTDGIASVQAALDGGADRIELCSSLPLGGLTPGIGLVEASLSLFGPQVMVMIRPRGGDFFYSDAEFEVMKREVRAVKAAGAAGVVLGLLLKDGQIDLMRTQQLVALARPLSVTFHRAFDQVPDPEKALEALILAGADRVLTSGLAPDALSGSAMIARLQQQAAGRIAILAGAGILPENVAQLVRDTNIRECHASAKISREGQMAYRRPGEVYGWQESHADTVRQIRKQLDELELGHFMA